MSGMTRGLLASATRLDRWLQVSVVVLLASCAWRYAARHRLDLVGWVLLAGAVLPDCWLGTGKMAHRPLLVSAELTRWLFRSQVRGGTLQPFAA